jgi:hypothetical protein
MPPALNALFLLAVVAYAGTVCSWRFSCLPA